jgi:hypothetical protein
MIKPILLLAAVAFSSGAQATAPDCSQRWNFPWNLSILALKRIGISADEIERGNMSTTLLMTEKLSDEKVRAVLDRKLYLSRDLVKDPHYLDDVYLNKNIYFQLYKTVMYTTKGDRHVVLLTQYATDGDCDISTQQTYIVAKEVLPE